jgi:hypothetical protein
MARAKQEVVTFKVDASLMEVLSRVPNRSEFIRSAVLAALDSVCPLCSGTGILTVDQRRHWEAFSRHHTVEECGDCHEPHLVCRREDPHGRFCAEPAKRGGRRP